MTEMTETNLVKVTDKKLAKQAEMSGVIYQEMAIGNDGNPVWYFKNTNRWRNFLRKLIMFGHL